MTTGVAWMTLALVCFLVSGTTALLYEIVWSRYLGLFLGSTAFAHTVVLAVFMGGLGLGNLLFGRRAANENVFFIVNYVTVDSCVYIQAPSPRP